MERNLDTMMLSLLEVDMQAPRLAPGQQDLGHEQHSSHLNWTISGSARATQVLGALGRAQC